MNEISKNLSNSLSRNARNQTILHRVQILEFLFKDVAYIEKFGSMN